MRGRKIISLVVCFLLSGACYSQFTDSFSDGDFMANPPWSGENGKFIVQSGILRLQAPPATDEAYLSTPSQSIHNGVWEFYLQMEFNPSSTNLARIYLASDKADLKGELNGYFVKAGNTTDEISLYRQDGNTETEIIDGLDGRLNLATVSMKVKVTRSNTGDWQLFSDMGSTGIYALEGSSIDNTHAQSAYSGVLCTYTSTRSDKFWFDDFAVSGTPVPDTTPPTSVVVKHKDIIITEALPDPGPRVQLPDAEFVEIYNRSPNPFNLAGWKLTDGSSTALFPDKLILPGEYWITTATSSAPLFTNTRVIGLSNFPTLNNSSDDVILRSPDGSTIDSIHYTLGWYRDEDKQEGGWSLEIIDPNNPCGEQDNWTASEDLSGGTPGNQNSVHANKPDLTGPLVVSAFPESPHKIVLGFNEKLDPQSMTPDGITILPALEIVRVACTGKVLRTVEVTLQQPLQTAQPYTLSISHIQDCAGNDMDETILSTGLPENAGQGDVVVNEILFNPRPGGVDFVEIYNVSSKFLNLQNWRLGNMNESPGDLLTVSPTNRLLRPGEYAVFTPDIVTLMSQYPQSPEEKMLESVLPGFPDDAGSVSLHDAAGLVLDGFSYSKDWHSRLIREVDGISLERIDPLGSSADRNNWISASSQAGYSTPGFANSHRRNAGGDSIGVSIVPEIFSPEGGPDAFVQIRYRFDASDWTANVKVFDQQGHLLKTIANNETLSTEGFFRWDGDRDDQRQTHRGYYVIWFEAFNTAGETRVFRNRVIVFSP